MIYLTQYLITLPFPYNFILIIAFLVITLAICIAVILDTERTPHSTLSWLVFFLLLPVISWLIFVLLGRHRRDFYSRREQLAKQEMGQELTKMITPLLEKEEERIEHLKKNSGATQGRLLNLAQQTGYSLLTTGNKLELLQSGGAKFEHMWRDLQAAVETIHMQYYEWYEDELTLDLKRLLIQKAQAGVKVRILVDAVGQDISRDYKAELRAAGVEIYTYFNYTSPLKMHTINYRNHRKIVIVDNRIAYMGGMNMGQMYIDGGEDFKSWRDTHLRLEGESAAVLQAIFINSWYNTTQEDLSNHIGSLTLENYDNDYLPIQITTSGPDSRWDAIKDIYFFMILDATKHVYIQSPFFIPDGSLTDALKAAALAGIDVRLMIARRGPGYNLPYWAANPYFADLAEAGIQIYLYEDGYLHAKTINVDDKVCGIGSANIDIRSFSINYEVTAMIYNQEVASQLAADFKKDIQACHRFDLEQYNKGGFFIHLRDALARLFSPVL